MHKRQRSRLLGSGIVMLLGCTLALAACNSSSGTSQKASGGANTVTGAEAPTSAAKVPAKGTIADALANQMKGQP
jgi:hypothetical protein